MIVLKMFPVNANFRAKMHKFDCVFRKILREIPYSAQKLILRKQGQTMYHLLSEKLESMEI